MSADCDLPTYLWSEAVSHANYLIIRSPTRANFGTTPEEKYTGKIPDLSMLKFFGCLVHVHVPKESRKKLDSKTQACIFLGIDSESKAFRLYDHRRRKVIISRDTVFDESRVSLRHAYQGEPETNNPVIYSGKHTHLAEDTKESQTSQPEGEATTLIDISTETPAQVEAQINDNPGQIEMLDLTYLPTNPAPVDRTADPPQRRYPTRKVLDSAGTQILVPTYTSLKWSKP